LKVGAIPGLGHNTEFLLFPQGFRAKFEQWKILRHTYVIGLFDMQAELVTCVEFCANGTAAQVRFLRRFISNYGTHAKPHKYLDQRLEDHINRRKSMASQLDT
jgi:hypothetical protein